MGAAPLTVAARGVDNVRIERDAVDAGIEARHALNRRTPPFLDVVAVPADPVLANEITVSHCIDLHALLYDSKAYVMRANRYTCFNVISQANRYNANEITVANSVNSRSKCKVQGCGF